MKRVMAVVCGMIFVLAFTGSAARAADKTACVDVSTVLKEYSKAKDYDKILTDKQAVYEGERDKMISEIKQFSDKINLLSDKEKEAKNKELQTKVTSLQEFAQKKETDLRKEQYEKMQEVAKDIEEVIKNYAEKEGYVLIFDGRGLLYRDKNTDITDKIIEMINKGSKK